MIKRIPEGLKGRPVVGPYSPGLEVSPGRFLFPGIIIDLDTQNRPVVQDRTEQITQVLVKAQAALTACGLGVRDLVNFEVRLAGTMNGFAHLNALMSTDFFSDLPFPVRNAYAVAELPFGVDIEIIMEAIRQEE